MNKEKKFSIIVLNYNNFEYLFKMIDSIYNQTYKNIELIIADDASNYFDKDKILEYINKKNNDIKLKIIINSKNVGTVKTVNRSLKKATGDYYLITASDDALANNVVISNFVKCFEETNCNVITSQWIICDNHLNEIKKYIPRHKFKQYNEKPETLLFEMCNSNRFGSGATAYKAEIFDNYKFDESYKYLEDWPFWLKLLLKKERIYFASFDGLLHRSGGISESKIIKDSTKQFYKELLDNFHREIIPNLNKFTNYQKWKILDSYKYNIEYYEPYFDILKYKKELYKIVTNNNKIKKYFIFNEMNPHLFRKIVKMFRESKVVPLSFLFTIIISFFVINYIENNNLKLLSIIGVYLFIYMFLCFIREVRRRNKWKSLQ